MAETALEPQEQKTRQKKGRSRARSLIGLSVLLGAVLLIWELFYIFAGGNLREVIPGRIYRSSQPNSAFLDRMISRYNIRTVFNLRGCCDPTNWYLDEASAAHKADISLEDFSFSAGRLPSTQVIKRLIEALDQAEEPILIHCHQGIDRTGLVAALWLLLKTQTTFEDALPQLSLRYVHLPWGRTGNMDRFFEYYRDWLQAGGKTHSPAILRDWIANHYIPGVGKARLELRDPKELEIVEGKGGKIGIRCTNLSLEDWNFRAGTNSGIHLYWYIITPKRTNIHAGLSGLFETRVKPGETITLEIPFPSHIPAGEYLLRVDMDEPWHARFVQMNGSIMEETVHVRKRPLARAEVTSAETDSQNESRPGGAIKPATIQGRNSP